jgi:HEAT repeat protein
VKQIQVHRARSHSQFIWLLISGAAAVAGYMGGGYVEGRQPDTSCRSSNAASSSILPPIASQAAHADGNGESTIEKAGIDKQILADVDPNILSLYEYEQLVLKAKQSPSFRQDLIKRFEKATDLQLKASLANLLTHVDTGYAGAYAANLVTSSDAAKRADGFRILTSIDGVPGSSSVRQQLIGALGKESDPDALQALIVGMNPGEVRPPQEVGAMVGRLSELTKNPSAAVRAAAVASLGRWGEGDEVESAIVDALSDPNSDVSTAAILASSQAGIKTPAVKSLLFQLASQQNADAEFRRVAAFTLGNFNLNPQEFERLLQVRRELGSREL